ncbi:hypothetical protein UT300012_23090 [Paraclostridium bifermentans]
MKLYGHITIDQQRYLVVYEDTKQKVTAYILSEFHKEDLRASVMGGELKHPKLTSLNQLIGAKIGEDYVAEGFSRTKLANGIQTYGRQLIVNKMLDLIGLVNSYSFASKDILQSEERMLKGDRAEVFRAKDNEVEIGYVRVPNKFYTEMHIKKGNMVLTLSSANQYRCKIKVDMQKVKDSLSTSKIRTAYLNKITLEDLREIYDLSWLEGKDYGSIKTIEEFEVKVMNEIVAEYYRCVNNGEEFVMSVDTETTGLNICYLSDDNPLKSHICATPISWKHNQAVVVFNDMEYFDNVPKAYMFERLKALVEYGDKIVIKTKRTGEVLDSAKLGELADNALEEENLRKVGPNDDYEGVEVKNILDRKKINLVGHNVMYDGKVFYDNKVTPYWNNDTMQMAFNLDPKAAKGKFNNKLKGLTRRIFGHETPELTDILGKGNEDKYKYLSDEAVAIIYGCADADYTRMLYFKLRELMRGLPRDLYNVYRAQDMEMINELYISEYYGLLMDEKKVSEMADKTEHDLKTIHNFLKNYIGKVVQKRNRFTEIESRFRSGEITSEQFKSEVANVRVSKDAIYDFEMKSSDYQKILFEILRYPIIGYTGKEGDKNRKPSTDKFTMKKLASQTLEVQSNQMTSDLMSDDGKRTLIKAKKFNSLKFPVAYALQEYKVLEKEFTSYFKPIRDQNLEGRLFKGYSLSRIETFRIMNPSQTMKSELKGLTLPFDGGKDWYMGDFDMAQVEYRIMVSIAGQIEMVDRLRDPEKDFHTESAAALKGIPAHTVDKKFRKQMKAVHFGIPYGLGDHSLCETMFGRVNESTMYETVKLKSGFCERNDKVIAMLEHHRDEALIPRDFSEEFKDFCGMYDDVEDENGNVTRIYKPVGWVKNEMGRYRLFDLSNLDKRKIGSIRRAAGNFPIQAFAAELFRKILLNFRQRCIKEGIKDKIIWHMLIHDELLFSAHKSINPFYLYKLILEECMVTIEGHTEYFVGINLGDNWKDCKDDLAEAPVLFVREMAKRWDEGEFVNDTWVDDAKSYVNKYKAEFIKQRIHDVIKELQPSLDNEPVDFTNIRNNMENYMVRAYITDFYIPNKFTTGGKVDGQWWDYNDDQKLLLALAVWTHRYFGEEKKILVKGRLVNASMLGVADISSETMDYGVGELDVEIDTEFLLDEEGEVIDDYFLEVNIQATDSYDMESGQFFNKQLGLSKKKELEHIKNLNGNIIINVPRSFKVPKVKKVLDEYISPKGLPILIKTPSGRERWGYLPNDKSLYELDGKISEVI